jgi:DNA-binding PucR family transcriptional regulator
VLTVRALAAEMGLDLAAGEEGADAPVRWVHITELADPTPWLSGGELLLTTGMQLESTEEQRALVARLHDHHLAGLGFGTGFNFDEVPREVIDEAESLGFPVFEVPYETPFIAITEKAFGQLVNEQYEVLQRSIATHKRLERLVVEERGLDEVVRALSAATGGAVLVLDARGEPLASRTFRRELSDEAVRAVRAQVLTADGAEFAPDHPEVAGRSLVLPVSARATGEPSAWLVAVRDNDGLGDFERLICQQATTVVALELMRQRAMRDTERRLAGDVIADAVSGRLEGSELAGRLRPFGVGSHAAVVVLAGGHDESAVERALGESGHPGLVAAREGLVVAVADADELTDPVDLAKRLREGVGAERAAVSRVAEASQLRRSFHEARLALDAAALANGRGPQVGSWQDLGAFQLLLSVQDDEALRVFCDSVLGPLEDGGREYGDELVRSLEAFIECNGQWERAARELFCHRHTLRYRIRRVEELTGRDLSRAQDRIEFWLALRARELVSE